MGSFDWMVFRTDYCRCVQSEKKCDIYEFLLGGNNLLWRWFGDYWLRRFNGKSKNDIVQVLKQTLFDLSSYEVLEIYPYPELVQNDWFISTLRIFNNFMLESSLRILTKNKQTLQTAPLQQ